MADSACNPMDRLLTTLKTRVPGVTDDMLNLELFNTLNEFFRRTGTWLYDTEITLNTAERNYSIFPPADTALVRVIAVSHNGLPLSPAQSGGGAQSQRGRLTPDNLLPDASVFFSDEMIPAPAAGTPFQYAIYFPTYITIDVPPDQQAQQYPLVATMALTLAQQCLECDCGEWGLEEWMYDMFFEDWLDGCAARLMSMISKPWTNPVMAAYHGKRFRQHMAYRMQEARRGYQYDVAAWRFPTGGFITRR